MFAGKPHCCARSGLLMLVSCVGIVCCLFGSHAVVISISLFTISFLLGDHFSASLGLWQVSHQIIIGEKNRRKYDKKREER